jgi:PAS domain S-box-containing protein
MYDEERALWQQHQRLDLAIRASRDGVFDIVVNTGQAYYSSRFLEIIGCNRSRKKLLPFFKEFLDRLHPDDREKVIEQFQAHLISGQPFLMDFRLRHYSGEYVWVNGRGCAYLNEFGKPLRFAGFITDISEQKKLDQMKSEFVSIASHQLRSPLTAIKWFCSILTSGEMGKLTKQLISCLGEIFESNERMIQLVNDLLMVSRIERTFPLNPSKEALDVGQVVKAAISDLGTLAHKKKIISKSFTNCIIRSLLSKISPRQEISCFVSFPISPLVRIEQNHLIAVRGDRS